MPETTNYMILGYIVTLGILFATLILWYFKERRLRQEVVDLETMEAEERQQRRS